MSTTNETSADIQPQLDDIPVSAESTADVGAQPAGTRSIPRRHDLDALRAIAMLLGILLHGALAYIPMPDQGWPVHDVRQSSAYGVVLAAIHGFRLPLFFLISGFFTAMLWRKRGLRALLMHRFKRIFLPLLIGLVTIVPAVWIVSIGAGISGVELGEREPNLWTAAKKNEVQTIKNLIAAGADTNAHDDLTGATPLAMAAWSGNVDAINALIEGGADVNTRNRDGSTPLHGAAFIGQADAAELLLDQGAEPAARNRLGETVNDTLHANWARVFIAQSFQGGPSDHQQIEDGRKEIAGMLADRDAGPVATFSDNQQAERDLQGLFLLVTMFPLFHHLWFLWFLCWLVAAFVLLVGIAKAIPWKLPDGLVLSPLRYVWLIPLAMIPQAMMGWWYPNFGPDTSAGFLPMPQILLYYAVFFFFGAIYFDRDDSAGQLGRWWPVTLPIALLIVFPLGLELSTGEFGFSTAWLDSPWIRPAAVFLQVAYVWLMTFGLMGMFRSCFSGESETMRYISDSSYWLYVAHLPLIIVAQAMLRTWEVPAFVKLTIVCVVCSALLLASYQWFVRYTLIGTLLNGPRKRPASAYWNSGASPN